MKSEIQTNVKTAIILAPDENGGLPVFGIPAIRRLILLVRQVGIQTIYAVGKVDPLRPIISDLLSPGAFHQAKDPELLDQLLRGLPLPPGERVLVLKANHIADRLSLMRLIAAAEGTIPFSMGTDKTGGNDRIYVACTEDLPLLLRTLWSPGTRDSRFMKRAQPVKGAAGLPDVIKKGDDQIQISEAKLAAALSLQTEAEDGFLARHVDRRLSRFFSTRLARTGVTPNQITLTGVTIGLAGAFFLSQSGYWPPLIGSLLFLFCVVIDGVDGEVARLRLQETSFGHYLDVITDNLVHVAVFIGMAFGLYHDTGDRGYLRLIGFLLGGFGWCAITVYTCILRQSPEELKNSPKLTRFMALLTNRDFAYLVVLFALIHRLNWFLVGATVGTYLFAATLWGMSLFERRKNS